MLRRIVNLFAPCLVLALCSALSAQEFFHVPVRINMGGPETEDSYGRTWLGDRDDCGAAQNSDPLGIRPDDNGGGRAECDWFIANFQPDSLDEIGFDSFDAGDVALFNSIRWDEGGSPPDFLLEIPVPDGDYHVNMYFSENCCPDRHFKIEVQEELLAEDVSYLSYSDDPALGRAGVLAFEDIVVDDGLLRIGILPCPECPGVADTNSIIDALEIISGPECDHLGMDFDTFFDGAADTVTGSWSGVAGADLFRVLRNGEVLLDDLPQGTRTFVDPSPGDAGRGGITYTLQALAGGVVISECRSFINIVACPGDLTCEVTPGVAEVALTWDAGGGAGVTGFEIRRNGELIDTVGATEDVYEDEPEERNVVYTVTPISDPPGQCAVLTCSVVVDAAIFAVPLRINMGGPETEDSLGRIWLGDRDDCGAPADSDPLGIRPDDFGGGRAECDWFIANFQPDSLDELGFDAFDPGDVAIFNSIRWDEGGSPPDFLLEIPIPDGDYLVNMYFSENCCASRHFKIEVQEELLAEDVSYLNYSDNPALGRAGVLSFEDIIVDDGILRIGILPCPECPGVTDTNSIIQALEILPGDVDICDNPDNPDFRACPARLVCEVGADGRVSGEWSEPLCVEVEGYELRRDGELIETLPGEATSFSADPGEGRRSVYELTPIVPAGVAPCIALVCTLASGDVPLEVPLRINMGGPEIEDSLGRIWLGDRDDCASPQNSDPLGIRPDDSGGGRAECDWFIANFQPDSLDELGFDPFDPGDVAIFNSIRWDEGGSPPDFLLEIPIPDGDYLVNMYFSENCCPDRHFKIEVQDELLAEDVSYLSYSDDPALGRAGVLSFEDIVVDDGLLRIGILPCPECPGVTDTNAIIDALEILPLDVPTTVFHRGDPNDDGDSNVTDAVYILNHLFGSGAAPTCQESADVNDDGSVNISDPVAILGFLFGGGGGPVPPAAPGPPSDPCGPDPAGSVDVGCDSYTSC